MDIELELIDCNCNNCIHMERDMDTFNKWLEWHKAEEKKDFDRKKAKAFEDAKNQENEQAVKAALRKAEKMQFQFDKSKLIRYGKCLKFNNTVSFIENTCMIENQICFEHRRLVNG